MPLPQDQLQTVAQQIIAQFHKGESGNDLQSALQQGLASAGASPDQISALQNDQITGSGAWGDGQIPTGTWLQQVMNAENSAAGGPNASAAATNNAATTNNANPAAAMAAPNQSITPATIQGQFPNGLPTATAQGVGGVPAVNAQQIDPNMSIAAAQAYLLPQFQQQQSALSANLANAGIVGGTAPQAAAQLGQQQQTTLQQNIQPFLQAGALANQSANLNAQTTNAGNTLQGSEFNATSQNQTQQFNIQNLLQTGQIDAATANSMMQYVMGTQNQDWLAQLGAQTSTTGQNSSQNNSAYQPIYQQPAQTSGLGNVAQAFQPNVSGKLSQPAAPTINQSAPDTSGAWLS